MILFLIDLDKMCVRLNIKKFAPNFRSLFYHDSIVKIFCSREQSTSHVHAHTFIELKKKTIKVTKLGDFDKVLRNVLWHHQGSLFVFFLFLCSLVLTILSACSII